MQLSESQSDDYPSYLQILLILVQQTHTPALGTIPNLLFIGQFYDENPDLMEGDSCPLPPHPPKFNNRDGPIMMENIESWAHTNEGSRSIEEELVQRAAHTGGDGRSGGRGQGNGASNCLQSNVPDCFSCNGILLNDGDYSNQIWREEFSQEERNVCLEMRRNCRNGGGGCGGRGRQGRGGHGHGISAVHDGQADQEETKEEDNNGGCGAGAGMSGCHRNNGGAID
ncbi:unnamed protein product [Cylindrotheca closterium]|uniref:Uncharacterized protein n=1 Tax=Cylindrotheca closterium TaxID=2856 RepID=A0AAD2G1P5_9STRA|nr:unnamed protein product [Cylindrotheca closterium]